MFRGIKVTTSNPSVTDDSTAGYSKGSGWYNSSSSAYFICTDDTDGAANWVQLSSSSSVNTVEVSLTSADILALNTTPIKLVDGAPGYAIDPISIVLSLTYNKAAYDTNTKIIFHNQASIGTKRGAIMEDTTTLASTSNVIHRAVDSASTASVTQYYDDDDLYMSVTVGNPATGSGTLKVYVTYQLIAL